MPGVFTLYRRPLLPVRARGHVVGGRACAIRMGRVAATASFFVHSNDVIAVDCEQKGRAVAFHAEKALASCC